jgi:hypothetical protein
LPTEKKFFCKHHFSDNQNYSSQYEIFKNTKHLLFID